MNYAISTDSLTYSFKKSEPLLRNIQLKVPNGSIYGLLGKNGAGKTTTIRLILGLLRNQQGSIYIHGQDLNKHRISILKNVGSLVESPSFYGHLSAKDNLRILQKLYQCSPSRIEEVLKIVGLSDVGNKKVNHYSLGMKQRLSIGFALLHEPKLLILDEPTNGLDPNGIVEMRNLLKQINQEYDTTILISSHLLSEIERIITDLAVIDNGKIIYQGTLKNLKLKQKALSKFYLKTDQIERTQTILSRLGKQFDISDQTFSLPNLTMDDIPQIIKTVVASDIKVYQAYTKETDLESMFINLTNQA